MRSPGPPLKSSLGSSKEVPGSKSVSWELRILEGTSGNAFALPDGAVYVDREMVQVLAGDPGLWAALLSHEIAHVTGQHWVRREALRDSPVDAHIDWRFFLRGFSLLGSILSAPAEPEDQEELAASLRNLELEADTGGLGLRVRAGFHPDFSDRAVSLDGASRGRFDRGKAFLCDTSGMGYS